MSAAFWKVFELAISVWENILLLEFCMDFMQQKPRGKKVKVLWGIAVLFGLIFPALEKYPALYDRWEMWITLIWLFVYLIGGYTGKCSEKGYCSGSCESSIDDGKHSDPFRRQFYPSRKCCIVYSRSGYK